jgi:uncharacterized membrane protein
METIGTPVKTNRQRQRWWVFVVVVGALLLMGFYAATNPELLHDHAPLEGADIAGYAFCHRLTDRSFTIAGRQMPLCARCTGMYLGTIMVFLVLGLAGRGRWSKMPSNRILFLLLGFVGLMGIDGLNSYSHFFDQFPHLYEPQNWLRLTTGMGTGLAMGLFVYPAMTQTLWRKQEYRPVIRSWAELAGLLLLAGVLIILILSNQAPILYVLGLMSAAGVVLILTCLNSLVLLILLKREAQADNWRQAAGPLIVGFTLAIVQIGVISILRFSLTGTMTGFPGL